MDNIGICHKIQILIYIKDRQTISASLFNQIIIWDENHNLT